VKTLGARVSGLGPRVVFLAAILIAAFARPAAAQWPTVIMFYGGDLKQPVFATGADTPPFSVYNFAAPNRAQAITANDMGDRTFIGVAFFWGPLYNPAHNGTKVQDLKPEMSFQHGRLYPASAGKPATMFMVGFDKLTSVQIKGRDIFGMLKVLPGTSGAVPAGQPVAAAKPVPAASPMPAGHPVPTDPKRFSVGRDVPPEALAVLKRLGVIR
jgi:hypothetical protein